jgi:hypothetical protein
MKKMPEIVFCNNCPFFTKIPVENMGGSTGVTMYVTFRFICRLAENHGRYDVFPMEYALPQNCPLPD